MSNVVPIGAKPIVPKQTKHVYKRQTIVLTFIVSTNEWEWSCDYHHTIHYNGKADTPNKALAAARRKIDYISRE